MARLPKKFADQPTPTVEQIRQSGERLKERVKGMGKRPLSDKIKEDLKILARTKLR